MTLRTLFTTLLTTAVFTTSAHAGDDGLRYDNTLPPAGDRYAQHCKVTPSLQSYGYPGKRHVHSSNKLARPAGKSIFADGQRLYLTGRIFDKACVPLRDAKVEVWHADTNGDYRIADKADLAHPYKLFAGAGQVRTDNRGEYVFETIMPGTKDEKTPPLINIRVSHPAMRSTLTTTLFFEGDARNLNSRAFRNLSEERKQLVTAHVLPFSTEDINEGLRVHHDITVSGRDGFRGF